MYSSLRNVQNNETVRVNKFKNGTYNTRSFNTTNLLNPKSTKLIGFKLHTGEETVTPVGEIQQTQMNHLR